MEDIGHLAFGRWWEGPTGRGTCCGHVVRVCGGVFWPSLRFLTFRHKQLWEISTPQAVGDSIRGSAAALLPGLPMQRVRRSRGRAGRITYHDFGEAAINSSSLLNSKRRRDSPPKIFQRNPNTPARIHKTLLPPSLIIPFFSAPWGRLMRRIKSHSVFPPRFEWPHQFAAAANYWGERKQTNPPPKKKPRDHACLKYLPCTNLWVKGVVN